MDAKRFSDLLEERILKIRSTLTDKADEYASTTDVLHNFKQAAFMQGITPAEALRGMMSKHLVSVMDLIRTQAKGGYIGDAMVNEKVGDSIVYLILLEAIFKE